MGHPFTPRGARLLAGAALAVLPLLAPLRADPAAPQALIDAAKKVR